MIPITILVLYSTNSSTIMFNDQLILINKWANHLKNKNSDVTWPFNTTIETYDYNGSFNDLDSFLALRLLRLPQVHVIHGPDFNYAKFVANEIAGYFGISILPTSLSSSAFDYGLPKSMPTTFIGIPPAPYFYVTPLQQFMDLGIKTAAFVWQQDYPYTSFNLDTCGGTSLLAEKLGMKVVFNYSIPRNYNITKNNPSLDLNGISLTNWALDRVIHFQPDLLMWCDTKQCDDEKYKDYFIPPKMKNKNYTPKLLVMPNCLDNKNSRKYQSEGWLDYVVEQGPINLRVHGSEFVEANNPYSSLFRPQTSLPLTVLDAITIGSVADSPSSYHLFMEWLMNATNTSDPLSISNYQIEDWALFDVIEAALYKSSKFKLMQGSNVLTPLDVFQFLDNSQTATPFGKVIFDKNRINTYYKTVLKQQQSRTDLSQIVGPSDYVTSNIIYPIPTWDERVYKWSFIGWDYQKFCFIVTTVYSFILLMIIITVNIFKNDIEIMMFNHFHITLMCFCILLFCWNLTIIDQADSNQIQCYLSYWVYFPILFPITMVSIRAYRLSLFLRSAISGKKAKPFPHSKVLNWTMMILGVIFVIYLILTFAVPEISIISHSNSRSFRPKYNIHICASKNGNADAVLQITLLIVIIFSIFSVAAVRNGFEAFQDGVVIKEAFVIFYFSAVTYAVIENLSDKVIEKYVLRTCLLGFGATFFMFRLMIGRCAKYWIPSFVLEFLTHIHQLFAKVLPDNQGDVAYAQVSIYSEFSKNEELDNGNKPQESNLEDMMKVFANNNRLEFFKQIADQNLILENVDFLVDIINYKKLCCELIIQSSTKTSKEMKLKAEKIIREYFGGNTSKLVNISQNNQINVKKLIENWTDNSIINMTQAEDILEQDNQHRGYLFDKAFKDIQVMLYQNIWNKFRIEELKVMASSNHAYMNKKH